jgi:hypothetical protein
MSKAHVPTKVEHPQSSVLILNDYMADRAEHVVDHVLRHHRNCNATEDLFEVVVWDY